MSLPSRGAWIEIVGVVDIECDTASLPSRGAWIEMNCRKSFFAMFRSLPSRGAWIEIDTLRAVARELAVAPLTGSVD